MAKQNILETHTFSREQRSRLFAELQSRFPKTAKKFGRDRFVARDSEVHQLAFLVFEAMELEAEKAVKDGEARWSAFAKPNAFIDGMQPCVPRKPRGERKSESGNGDEGSDGQGGSEE